MEDAAAEFIHLRQITAGADFRERRAQTVRLQELDDPAAQSD